MNALSKVKIAPGTTRIAHSILAYDRATEELAFALPIPLFLDTLALKVASVPPQDQYGALSYPLHPKAIDTFRFLLGLEIDTGKRDYFLESTAGQISPLPPGKLQAVERLTEVTPHPRYARTTQPLLSKRELVLPTLRLLDSTDGGWMATTDLIDRLTSLFSPTGRDAEILQGRIDTHFSQIVRNIISHRDEPSSFIHRGLAHYERHGLRISTQGRTTVRALLS